MLEIIENGNSHCNSINSNMGNFGRHGDTYVVVGQQSDLVVYDHNKFEVFGKGKENNL
jgi:hypothetical protein